MKTRSFFTAAILLLVISFAEVLPSEKPES
jgi:hypothetical protein